MTEFKYKNITHWPRKNRAEYIYQNSREFYSDESLKDITIAPQKAASLPSLFFRFELYRKYNASSWCRRNIRDRTGTSDNRGINVRLNWKHAKRYIILSCWRANQIRGQAADETNRRVVASERNTLYSFLAFSYPLRKENLHATKCL